MKILASLAAGLLCLPLAVSSQPPAPSKPAMPSGHPPIGGTSARAAPSPWSEFADYTLTVKVPPKGETGTWKYRTFASPADMVVEIDAPGAKGRSKGSIMLVGGQGIAVKGLALEPGFEVDPLDVAIVNLKVLTRLLDAALPAGPAALKGKQVVDRREDSAPIEAFTPSSTARFAAPWSLKGSLERVDANTVSFRFELEAPGGEKPGERSRWTFAGTASGAQKGRVMEDATNLAGWTAYTLAPPKSDKSKAHTALRFGATRLAGPHATLKDLRADLAKTP
jgi:hypothetical protein